MRILAQSSSNQLANLFDRIIYLHIEHPLAKLRCRAARISNNAVVDPLDARIGFFAHPRYGVAK
jgi:hypothetical protein